MYELYNYMHWPHLINAAPECLSEYANIRYPRMLWLYCSFRLRLDSPTPKFSTECPSEYANIR